MLHLYGKVVTFESSGGCLSECYTCTEKSRLSSWSCQHTANRCRGKNDTNLLPGYGVTRILHVFSYTLTFQTCYPALPCLTLPAYLPGRAGDMPLASVQLCQRALPCQEGHKRRDVPMNISAGLKAAVCKSLALLEWKGSQKL